MSDKVILGIRGMTCAACVRRVEEGLRQMPGVQSVTVNFATEKAHVEYDPGRVSVADLRKKVRDIGYEAFADDASASGAAQPRPAWLPRHQRHDSRPLDGRRLHLPGSHAGRG